jgi:hypothetical protein
MMAGICPNCKKELTAIREFQKVEVAYDVSLDTDNGKFLNYEKHDDYDSSDNWGEAECPECDMDIKGLNTEAKAMEFLKGNKNWKKVK